MDVVKIADMTTNPHIERELLLMKLKVPAGAEQQLSELIAASGARALDDKPDNYTLELTGSSEHMDRFIERVSACAEILAVVRSGAMAIARGPKVLKAG